MHESALHVANLFGNGAVLGAAIALPALFFSLVLAEQLESLRRAEAQSLVPTAWKRALAGSWTLRGRVRLPRRIRLR